MLETRQMHDSFAFIDAGRTFDCCVETPRRPHAEAWWWFTVSGEAHQRFAPFRAVPGDTQDAVRGRIVAYYENLLERRAAPSISRWGRRPQRPFVTAAPASPPTEPT